MAPQFRRGPEDQHPMLKANVGLSRKLSKDYNSTGFTLNLEGEILATTDDPENVIARIRELYSLAEEALDQQIADSQSVDAFRHRDAEPAPPYSNGHNGHAPRPNDAMTPQNGQVGSLNGEPATNKQVQFLQTLAKRQRLFGAGLESYIGEVVGRRCSPYDLTKKEAAEVINRLNPEESSNGRGRR